MAELGRPAKVAIGFAVVALLTSLVAVVVVMRRSSAAPVPVTANATTTTASLDRTVEADEVTKLKRDVVEKATDDKGNVIGVTMKDESLRTSLGLEQGDVITAIGGRAIKREFDVYDAVLGMSMMDASIVYVEVIRKKQPVLMRWKLEGDLRSARRDTVPRPRTGGVLGGGLGGAPPSNPFTAPDDPLLDTIRKIDDLQYEVPRSTVDRLMANPDQVVRGARLVPAMKNGQPDGFKIFAIRPGSLWSTLGFGNGDTIRSVNGTEITSIDKALEAFVKVPDAKKLEVGIQRRGAAIQETLVITIK